MHHIRHTQQTDQAAIDTEWHRTTFGVPEQIAEAAGADDRRHAAGDQRAT